MPVPGVCDSWFMIHLFSSKHFFPISSSPFHSYDFNYICHHYRFEFNSSALFVIDFDDYYHDEMAKAPVSIRGWISMTNSIVWMHIAHFWNALTAKDLYNVHNAQTRSHILLSDGRGMIGDEFIIFIFMENEILTKLCKAIFFLSVS